MELEISRDELIGALRKVTSIIANRSTLPMLSNVLFTAKDNELCLNTSDLDISILTRIPATVKKEGEATLPAKKLTQMIAMAPHEMVHFSTDENFSTTVTSGRFRFCLRGINPSEFVRLEERDDDRLILSLPKQDFRKMLQKITYAVNPEESRYLLRGICLNINDGTCTTVGTDGKRLSLVEKILDNGMELPNEEYIFPIKLVHEVEKLMDGEGEMKLYVNKSDVTVKFDTTVVNAKLIEGKYPAFRLAIPKEHEFSVEIDRVQLIDVINRVSLVISDVEENPVRFI
ncbi:MAG: DNA polymerase III subunit beta, partial [Lentisphaerae bacterium]